MLYAPGSMLAKTSRVLRTNIVAISELPPPPPGGMVQSSEGIPTQFALQQAFPKPFNPVTSIRYQLPIQSRVGLRVYSMLGQLIAELINEEEHPGFKQVEWNAGSVASGLYFYRFEATSVSDPSRTFTQVRKMLLVK